MHLVIYNVDLHKTLLHGTYTRSLLSAVAHNPTVILDKRTRACSGGFGANRQ
jgi:hypothetical protein